jgi:hypothetical protein
MNIAVWTYVDQRNISVICDDRTAGDPTKRPVRSWDTSIVNDEDHCDRYIERPSRDGELGSRSD